MDEARKERVIDWRLLGRRLRRPLFWLVVAALVVGGVAGGAAAKWLETKPDPAPREGFRFDEVFVVEGGTDGNRSAFRIVPWMSNGGKDATGTMRLVVYVLESDRYVVRNESALEVGTIPGRRTLNVSAGFELNNTRSYQIEILAFEDDYIVARGHGTVGFHRYGWLEGDSSAPDAFTVTLNSGQFSYDYPDR